MSQDNITPLTPYQQMFDSKLSIKPTSITRANPKVVRLQRIEQALKEYILLKGYLTIMILYSIVMLIIDVCNSGSAETTIDIIVKVGIILGYGYGLQAFSSKVFWQWRIFFYFVILYFGAIGYYIYTYSQSQEWFMFGLNVVFGFINIVLLIAAQSFSRNLQIRDQLKVEIAEENVKGSIDSAETA